MAFLVGRDGAALHGAAVTFQWRSPVGIPVELVMTRRADVWHRIYRSAFSSMISKPVVLVDRMRQANRNKV